MLTSIDAICSACWLLKLQIVAQKQWFIRQDVHYELLRCEVHKANNDHQVNRWQSLLLNAFHYLKTNKKFPYFSLLVSILFLASLSFVGLGLDCESISKVIVIEQNCSLCDFTMSCKSYRLNINWKKRN